MLTKPHTSAGKKYIDNLTAWLQDTRLMSEAVFRLYKDYQNDGMVKFSSSSWPKKSTGGLATKDFTIKPIVLGERMGELLKNMWSTRFVFLETLWEEYLRNVVQELRHEDATVFEPFCERDFMADIVRDVITDSISTIDDVKSEVATRFATGITRQSWPNQWKQLARLKIGICEKDKCERWFSHLETYFEMRNCLIHLKGEVSNSLKRIDSFFANKTEIEIWPPHLDHYRHQFIDCLLFIESKIYAKFHKQTKTGTP
ncbi:MAG: hypothetical protein ABFC88_13585 [Thermoguttaceae bacterium]